MYILYREGTIANDVPKYFQKIREDKDEWLKAVNDELNSLQANNTGTLVEKL